LNAEAGRAMLATIAATAALYFLIQFAYVSGDAARF
jgi:hypothetical protein